MSLNPSTAKVPLQNEMNVHALDKGVCHTARRKVYIKTTGVFTLCALPWLWEISTDK